jgi:hypothetical protein
MVTGLTGLALVPIIVLVVLLAVDGWVYADAKEQLEQGNRVSVSLGSFRVESPQAWFLGCLILWVVFFPLYLTVTGRNPFADSRG